MAQWCSEFSVNDQEVVIDNNLSDSKRLYGLQPRKQQRRTIQAFKLVIHKCDVTGKWLLCQRCLQLFAVELYNNVHKVVAEIICNSKSDLNLVMCSLILKVSTATASFVFPDPTERNMWGFSSTH